MKKIIFLLLLVALAAPSFSQKNKKNRHSPPPPPPAFTLKSGADSISYTMGILSMESVNQQLLKKFNIDVDMDVFLKAMADYMKDTFLISPEQSDEYMSKYISDRETKKAESDRVAGIKFLEENSKKPGVIKTSSGLQYEVIQMGTGNKPGLTDRVKVHYTGTLVDGTVFDSSVKRGEPAVFILNQVIPGWTEGLQLMPEGSKFRFYIPSELGYGSRSAGPIIKPNSVLIFDIELISILPKQ
jgi:FKBP-type peptidyl-prolyl cis-trans isomerase FklB